MRKRLAVVPLLEAFFVAGIVCAAPQPAVETNAAGDPLVSTFSIVALDPATGDLGIAVQSKFPNVRAVVPWARAGVGAVATQSFAKLSFGSDGLDLLARGATAEEALTILLREDPLREQRQVGIVDARGHAATVASETRMLPWMVKPSPATTVPMPAPGPTDFVAAPACPIRPPAQAKHSLPVQVAA